VNFDLHLPTRVVFGRGRLDELGRVTRQFSDRALLMTGRTAMRTSGYLQRAVDILRAAGVKAEVFEGVSANPRSDEVDQAMRLARAHHAGAIIGMGGGSVLDAAKAAAVAIQHTSVGPLVGTTIALETDTLPVIAVPTTAGSGAEVTKGAIITDIGRGFKSGIRGDALFPRVAVVDPTLTDHLPRRVALESGFDALAHAVEGAVARRSTPLSRNLSHQAATLLSEHLPRVAQDRADAHSRDALSLAALLGGINVANASTCLPHRLQQAMGQGGPKEPSHGLGLAILYPAWLRYAYPHAPGAFDAIAAAMGHDDIHRAVYEFLNGIGLHTTLSSVGYSREDIPAFLANISGNLDNDPIEDIDDALIEDLYRSAL